jgi:hypothetical protein
MPVAPFFFCFFAAPERSRTGDREPGTNLMTALSSFEPNTSIPLALPSLQQEDHLMADHQNIPKLKTSRQIYEDSMGVHRQVDDGRPRQSEDDMQRAQFGPRGVLGQPDPAKMVPQRKKKTPTDFDPGHTA